MASYKLKEKIYQKVKQRLKELRGKKRKQVEGHVNIEGVTTPRKRKPKKVKQTRQDKNTSAVVSIGARGGRYIQEASGHKKYVAEGKLSGRKKYTKSIKETLGDVILKSEIRDFIRKYKKEN